jgi:hypothetical protein
LFHASLPLRALFFVYACAPSVSHEDLELCMDQKSAPVTINLPPELRRACKERPIVVTRVGITDAGRRAVD